MEINYEYVDPFDEKYDYLMRIEHLGRYYFASNLLKNCEKVLDIACADGYGTKILSESVDYVVGIDRNEKYLNVAKTKYDSDNIEYKCIDVDEETVLDKYDGIVCFETLEHLKYPERLLHNLYNILDKDGVMILSIPNSKYEIVENGQNKDSFHLHIFDYNKVIKMFEKVGFFVEKVYGQSYINKIVNKEIDKYELTNVSNDAKTIAFPNEDDIDKTYSYIFILKKEGNLNERK